MRERLGHVVVDDRDALVHGVLFFPRRCLHLLEPRAHDDLDVVAAEAPRAAAAVHGGIAAAQDDDALADLVDVAEGNARQPVDADMDVLGCFLAARYVEIAPARRAAAHHDRVVALGQQCGEAVDARSATELDAHVEDIADLLVDHRLGKAKLRDLTAYHPAGLRVAVEDCALVAERRQVARRSQRGRSGADEGDALSVLARRALRHPVADVVALLVGGDALQAADRDRFRLDPVLALFHPTAAASGLTGPVAGAAENAGKDVGLPVDHVGVAVTTRGDQPYVFGNRCMGGTRPLAIDNLVKVIGCRDIRRLQTFLRPQPIPRRAFIPCFSYRYGPGKSWRDSRQVPRYYASHTPVKRSLLSIARSMVIQVPPQPH